MATEYVAHDTDLPSARDRVLLEILLQLLQVCTLYQEPQTKCSSVTDYTVFGRIDTDQLISVLLNR